MNISDLSNAAQGFRAELTRLKSENPPKDFTWYGYDILANCHHLDKLLTAQNRDIFSRVVNEPIADIGAADGDFGFLFERQGFDVDIIDWPATNWNGLRGAPYLRDLLGSKATIHEVDLDAQFQLPRPRYGMAVLLGILYHLKNPYFVLEKLAQHARYCLVSTRVARFNVDNSVELAKAPVAYLLAPDECNNDSTNYWIFSVPGLQRLFERSGWQMLDFKTLGDTQNSNPSAPNHDERAFALLESRLLL